MDYPRQGIAVGNRSCSTCALATILFMPIIFFSHYTRHRIFCVADEQYTTINQSTAGHFDPRVFANCLQLQSMYNQLLDISIAFNQ